MFIDSGVWREFDASFFVRELISVLALLLLSSPIAVAQEAGCLICEPMIALEPAAFARNLDADAGDVDFLARVHVMAKTFVPRLSVSGAVQWVVPHGENPMVMAHLAYTLLGRPLGAAAFLGVMNLERKGDFVFRPMAAFYLTGPNILQGVQPYGLGTLAFADEIIPSLALGLRIHAAPLQRKGERGARHD